LDYANQKNLGIIKGSTLTIAISVLHSSPHSFSEKAHLLLIDDNPSEQRYLVDVLRPHYHLSMAFDGQQGYQRALTIRPDLILLDVSMPKMDGFSACQLLKADPLMQSIPVIFLSALNTPEERVHGLQCGGVDYVVKPFSAEEVLARVRIHLDLARKQVETTPSADPRDPSEVVLMAAQRMIDQRLDTPPSLLELARMLGISEKKLTQIFRDKTGQTVFAYVREVRLRRAVQLLTTTNLSVQDISAQLGFENPANFATAFRERMGTTPRGYRQALTKSL